MSGPPLNRRPANNTGSLLLTPQENEVLFSHLDRKCTSLSAAVVQVYGAERNSSWVKKCCGVACLVKDNPQRSYFIRVFDMRDGKSLFAQELYNNFSINCSRPYFITFAGDTCQIGLNFASEEEARRFKSVAGDLMSRKGRKTGPSGPLGPTLPMATVDIKNPEINNPRHQNNIQMNNINLSNFNRKDKGKGKPKGKKKISKAEIGTPSNFRHVGHVGWDPNTGFDLNNLDPELKHLFDMCGISEAQLKDKETSKDIYEFIEKRGGVEAVKSELRRQAPPPPSRGGPPPPPPPHHNSAPPHHNSAPPPPPPSRGRGAPPPPPPSRGPTSAPPPPPPPSRPGAGAPPPPPPSRGPGMAPPPPPPPHPASLSPPPPPPPPPSSMGGAPPPPPPPPPGPPPPMAPPLPDGDSGEVMGGKSALLDQIREGAQLKKVDQNNKPPASGGGRDALLDQIRQGIQLKNVSDATDSSTPSTPAPSSGIVGALMEVMQKRSKAIHSSDEDDDDDDVEDFEDEDEWDD
ncbi:WASP like actin nucleation promoting factor b isoform X2 [Labeo rohita]|uniref:WASP like actin nucleation promoting factor b isoform X2 n=1 Tax=Labeo rohita TaxID=84645 RepID=UPI0021E347E0|nr:WASP like actin nucleation promoting factor b isoform X2 [Labeo rohita]